MSRRQNAWPAYVDLFGGLLITTLGGLMMLTEHYKNERTQDDTVSGVRRKADDVARRLNEAMRSTGIMDSEVGACVDDPQDVCVNLSITFNVDETTIKDEERPALSKFGEILKTALEREFTGPERKMVQIVVEGHADTTPVRGLTERDAYLYNWNISAGRATSVLWEFHKAELNARQYNIAAIGYADSRAECASDEAECLARDRRTTVRLHVDNRAVSGVGAAN